MDEDDCAEDKGGCGFVCVLGAGGSDWHREKNSDVRSCDAIVTID